VDAELLKQALLLTAIGMGMTFAAIGALVLGMVVLGGIKPRKPAEVADEEPAASVAEAATIPDTADARYLAAVAAVAVALAQSVREDRRSSGVVVDQWRSHVRSRHLTQRDY
jgi:Na+-transporting methylmalonyl-CoA/oxaloacetate decarboxylase gamma subunit